MQGRSPAGGLGVFPDYETRPRAGPPAAGRATWPAGRGFQGPRTGSSYTATSEMYVCLCQGITDARVRQLGRAGVTTPKALIESLGLDAEECCGYCRLHVDRLVAIARGGDPLTYGRFEPVKPREWKSPARTEE